MNPQSNMPTQSQRRVMYGANVAILVVAVLAIVVIANYIGHRHLKRFDFTASGEHSLSPQTLNMLKKLDADIQITALVANGVSGSTLLERVDDKIKDYVRQSRRITYRTVDPASDKGKYDQFVKGLLARFGDATEAYKAAFLEVKKLHQQLGQFAQAQTASIKTLGPKLAPEEQRGDIAVLMRQVMIFLGQLDQDLKDVGGELDQALAQQTPDYRAARSMVVSSPTISSLDQVSNVLKQILTNFDRLINNPATSAALKDALLGMKLDYSKIQADCDRVNKQLSAIDTADYDNLRKNLGQENSVVISLAEYKKEADPAKDAAPKAEDKNRGVVVLPLTEIFPNLIEAQLRGGEVRPEQGWKGEEAITSAILRLTFKHKTKIVFVNPGPQPVLMRGGQMSFASVADRLRKMNFEVVEWQPAGGGQQGAPPEPMPTAEPGQKLVLVSLPAPPPDFRSGMGIGPAGPMAAEAVKKQIESGQPAILFLATSNSFGIPQPEPMLDALKPFGINVEAARVVVTQDVAPNGRTLIRPQLPVSEWVGGHPISQAVRGLRGIVVQSMPIDVPAKAPEGVKLWPLLKSPRETWAESDVANLQQAKQDVSDPIGPFTLAVAAEKGTGRLVVVTDPVWASDMVVQYGRVRDMETGEAAYSDFPANAELFVNSVAWLAGVDDLIAAGARTLDVRRIGAVDRGSLIAIWWGLLAVLPLGCLGVGVMVWVVRRR